MLYAVLAYHEAGVVETWSPEEDAALMNDLHKVHERLTGERKLGPAARLGATKDAVTLRSVDTIMDGPFAETKEQLLGFYVLDCATRDEAIAAAQDLRRVNPSAIYEIREISLYLPGATLSA